MTPTDKELEAAAEAFRLEHLNCPDQTALLQLIQTPEGMSLVVCANHRKLGFKAGAHFERERILTLLRSDEASDLAIGDFLDNPDTNKLFADYIEKKLNEQGKDNAGL